jgi:hypothetical protein
MLASLACVDVVDRSTPFLPCIFSAAVGGFRFHCVVVPMAFFFHTIGFIVAPLTVARSIVFKKASEKEATAVGVHQHYFITWSLIR